MSTATTSGKKAQVLQTIIHQGLLPLYFHPDEEVCINVLRALYDAGIRSIEYTNRGEAALHNFRALRRVCDAGLHEMQLGVGTIKTGDEAKAFADAGADYLISPGVVKAAAKVAEKNDLLYVPGCMTPTEIIKAEALGATFLKVFPGNILGTGYISSIREIFPNLKFMVTGGVEPEEGNLRSWFKAGVVAVGMGSKMISKEILEAKDYAKLTELTKQAMTLVDRIPGEPMA